VDLIVTHTNADFDALGSLIAAKKLYPHSRLLLPGSPESAVREFLSLFRDVIKVDSEGECDLKDIKRLIVVDTRHKSRIGIASRLIDERGILPIIYDHHPKTESDMPAAKSVHRELGATITILLDIIKKRRIRLSPIEATILLLGIYEETGSLTYRTTTRKDVDAVSFLLSHKARLDMVSSYLNRELTEEELAFLVRLINSTRLYDINGVKIAISECISASYVGELATIVHKLIEAENLKVVFVLLKVDSKINIVARSHIPDVDVNKILKHFGGGGHSAAASGKVKGVGLDTLKSKLLELLKKSVRIKMCARDIMSRLAAVSVDTSIKEAKRFLARKRVNAAVVLSRNKKLIGIINTKSINKAIRRRFGHARVKGYMFTKIETIRPTTPLHAVQQLLSSGDIGMLPVLEGKRLTGMVNRNDVLKALHHGLIVDKKITRKLKRRPVLSLAKKMKNALPAKLMRLLKAIGKMAEKKGFASFVIGGFVRDLIMNVRNYDVDIVIEGNAIEFAKSFADTLKGSLVIHKKFGTATVVMPWGLASHGRFKVDIATARKERYEFPAALPDVEFSSLRDDLYRRDFTINAMAVALNSRNFGQLIDFFNGQRHIKEGIISVLHRQSFIDDPTRIFRAVRFEQRYGFKIDKKTENLIKNAIKKDMFGRTGNMRIRDELILILKEEDPMRAIKRMHQLDELRFIHPEIKIQGDLTTLFRSIKQTCRWYKKSPLKKRSLDDWLMFLMALFENLDKKDARAVCHKFAFRRGDTMRIASYKEHGDNVLRFVSQKRDIPPSSIYKKLRPLSYEVILMLHAKADDKKIKSRIINFLLNTNDVKIKTTGEDLERFGFKPGPALGRALKEILYARIDGKIRTKKEELSLAREMLK